MKDNEQHFVSDLVTLVIEKAFLAKNKANNGGDFDKGMHMAYYDILSTIQNQAEAFGIPLDKVGLKNLDIDKDLL